MNPVDISDKQKLNNTTSLTISNEITQLHESALLASKNFRAAELELINILQEVRRKKVYLALGFGSLFEYAVSLELSESNAYAFCAIARKSEEIPELKKEIAAGNLTVSKARRILPVITRENKTVWLEKATTLTKNQLERAVVQEKPELLKRETVRRIQEDRISVNFSVSDELMNKIKRVQNLLSSKKRKNMNLEDSLNELVSKFLEKNDPVVKAKRVLTKPATPVKSNEVKVVQKTETFFGSGKILSKKRISIPALTKHQLILQNNGECTYVATNGNKCQSSRWLNIHHKHHVANGGGNDIQNLQTLCRTHHEYVHR